MKNRQKPSDESMLSGISNAELFSKFSSWASASGSGTSSPSKSVEFVFLVRFGADVSKLVVFNFFITLVIKPWPKVEFWLSFWGAESVGAPIGNVIFCELTEMRLSFKNSPSLRKITFFKAQIHVASKLYM